MAGGPTAVAKGVYSVWALPPEDVRDRLKSLMGALRSEFGGPKFEPHITVVGAISLGPDDALRRFRSACTALSPYPARVSAVSRGAFFYQCVFLLMGPAYRIISVKIFSGDVVDAMDITFTYYGKTETRHFGGSGGTPHEIVLQEGEYLVGMAGEVANYHGLVVVGKLGFSTNKKAYGPFGNAGGTPFSLPISAGKISGFFGRDGQFLDAIGVYLAP